MIFTTSLLLALVHASLISAEQSANQLHLSLSQQPICPVASLGHGDKSKKFETSSHPINQSPLWSEPPKCIRHTKYPSTYCVYTSTSFASGRGISMFTTPEHAARIISVPAFASPNGGLGATNTVTDAPFEARELPGRGIGLVATGQLSKGQILMAYTPVIMTNEDIFDIFHENDRTAYLDAAVQRLPESSTKAFMNLLGHFGGPVTEDIINTNSFALDLVSHDKSADASSEDDDDEEYTHHTFVIPEVARFNHDCRPNAHYNFNLQTMTHTVRTLRPISPGEELTISYIDPVMPTPKRKSKLKRNWGFDCSCAACKNPSPQADNRIAEIDYLTEILQSHAGQPKSRNVTTAMAEKLISLYEQEGLLAPIAEAYTLAAIEFNAYGMEVEARSYAEMAVEAGILHSGEMDGEVQSMRLLVERPRGHWSWGLGVDGGRGGS